MLVVDVGTSQVTLETAVTIATTHIFKAYENWKIIKILGNIWNENFTKVPFYT